MSWIPKDGKHFSVNGFVATFALCGDKSDGDASELSCMCNPAKKLSSYHPDVKRMLMLGIKGSHDCLPVLFIVTAFLKNNRKYIAS